MSAEAPKLSEQQDPEKVKVIRHQLNGIFNSEEIKNELHNQWMQGRETYGHLSIICGLNLSFELWTPKNSGEVKSLGLSKETQNGDILSAFRETVAVLDEGVVVTESYPFDLRKKPNIYDGPEALDKAQEIINTFIVNSKLFPELPFNLDDIE